MLDTMVAVEPMKCRFEDLCEECYPDQEMAEYRKKCNSENCDNCWHYWDFFEGYCAFMEAD